MRAPVPFDLDLTVRSHGFYDLAPWRYDAARSVLSRPLLLSAGRVVLAEVAPEHVAGSLALRLTASGRISAAEGADARNQIRTCLALDEDLEPFYRLIREMAAGTHPRTVNHRARRAARGSTSSPRTEPVPPGTGPVPPGTEPVPPGTEPVPPGTGPVPPGTGPVPPGTGPVPPGTEPVPPGTEPVPPLALSLSKGEDHQRCDLPRLSWAAERGAGRLLRSPTVFEDAVKTLCTTNCSWALTRAMIGNLVARLGERGPRDERAFPTPAAMAEQPERFYRDAVRAGYRAGALRSIARDVASGALDPERWRDPAIPTDQLATEVDELPGFGPYATEHLLRLLGRYDHLALDSWIRAKLTRIRGRRRVPADRTIRRWYAPYGRFAGLAMWLEVTADWHGPRPTWP